MRIRVYRKDNSTLVIRIRLVDTPLLCNSDSDYVHGEWCKVLCFVSIEHTKILS